MKTFVALPVLFCILVSCNQPSQVTEKNITAGSFEGIYVSEGYALRGEGYDWVAISLCALTDSSVQVAVRSRADLKNTTCTFDSEALVTEQGLLSIPFEDKEITLTLQGDTLKIGGRDEKSSNLLYYFCSGGGTLKGTYTRVTGPFDETQLFETGFEKTLSLQGITFNVTAVNTGFRTELTIESEGLEVDNTPAVHSIQGWISGAETEDLNSDGSPELLIYIRSTEGGNLCRVIGYSVNAGKSMSQVSLPELMENPEASQGYIGYDEFAIVETSLVRRFPIFEWDGSTYEPTGKTRQIQYRLEEGEALRHFRIESITEF
jgi:hypothetical protein